MPKTNKFEFIAMPPEDTFVFTDRETDFLKVEGNNKSITVNDGALVGTLKVIGDGSDGVVEAALHGNGRITRLQVAGTDLDVVMNDSSRVRILQHFNGDADITTGSGYIALIETWQSNVTLNVGSGYIGAISLGSPEGGYKHTITVEGGIGDLSVSNDKTVLKLGAGGAGSVHLGNDKDIVTTGSGSIGSLYTGGGNDKVTLHGNVEYISVGEGNDKIKIVDVEFDYGRTLIEGGGGKDTLDFSKAAAGVTFELDGNFHYNENVGHHSAWGVENLTGTKYNDNLTGDAVANKLVGGKGNDRLDGKGGNDLLVGGAGRDTFVFGVEIYPSGTSGTDRVKDYVRGKDSLEIGSHEGGFEDLVIRKSNGNLVIGYDEGTIILVGHKNTTLTETDFDFV